MLRKLFIFILCLLIESLAYAKQDVSVYFYVDNLLTPLPNNILEQLQNTPTKHLDTEIITSLIKSNRYDSVITNEYIDIKNNTFFVVNAETSKKIKSIRLVGVDSNILYKLQRITDAEIGKKYSEKALKRIQKKNRKRNSELRLSFCNYREDRN